MFRNWSKNGNGTQPDTSRARRTTYYRRAAIVMVSDLRGDRNQLITRDTKHREGCLGRISLVCLLPFVVRVFLLIHHRTFCFLIPNLACIVQTGGDSVDSRAKRIFQLCQILPLLLASKKFHLDQAHRVYVWIAQMNGASQHTVAS